MGTMKGRSISTRKMSDAHEDHLSDLLGGHKAKGSGNQWHDPIDGRQNHREIEPAFAWDAKSTLGKSIGLTPEAWDKAVEQAHPERPAMPLRWYADERLTVTLDLVAVGLLDFSEVLAMAQSREAVLSDLRAALAKMTERGLREEISDILERYK